MIAGRGAMIDKEEGDEGGKRQREKEHEDDGEWDGCGEKKKKKQQRSRRKGGGGGDDSQDDDDFVLLKMPRDILKISSWPPSPRWPSPSPPSTPTTCLPPTRTLCTYTKSLVLLRLLVDWSGVSSLCSFRHDTMATTTKLEKAGRRREWAVLAEAGAARERRA